jgi:hypothetical protein
MGKVGGNGITNQQVAVTFIGARSPSYDASPSRILNGKRRIAANAALSLCIAA